MYVQRPIIIDNFCLQAEEVRQSALIAGFGTWEPGHGKLGVGKFSGVGFALDNKWMMLALTNAMGGPVIPNSMFARVSNKDADAAYIHSDRSDGQFTAICYLSHEEDESHGTGFYRYKTNEDFPGGLDEMPCYQTQDAMGSRGRKLQADMRESSPEKWELTSFVKGKFNRCIIFHAPLFHSRLPIHGIGDAPESARMVWVCHFSLIPQS